MKKKIFISLIILLFSVINKSISQPQVVNWYRITKQSPPLNYNPTVTTNTFKLGYYNINPINGSQHVWEPGGGSWTPTSLFASGGAGGSSTNTSWTIGPNNSYNSDLTISPERYGAIHANQTIAQRYGALANQVAAYYNYLLTYDTAGCTVGVPNSPFNVPPNCGYYTPSFATSWINSVGAVTINDYVDWAAWQVCIKIAVQRAYDSGGSLTIVARGPIYYIGNRAIVLATSPGQNATPIFPNTNQQTPSSLVIEGNHSTIVTTGISAPTINIYGINYTANAIFFRETRHLINGNGTWFNRATPLVMCITINNLTLECTSSGMGTFGNSGTTIGISLGATYGSYYCGIKGKNLSTLIVTRFQLKTIIKNCIAIDCRHGFYLGSGNWFNNPNPSANYNQDSQSNTSTVSDCIYENNTPNGGGRAFTFEYASGCGVENSIIRGTRIRNGIIYNGDISVSKEFNVSNIEFDVNTTDTAAIYIIAALEHIITVKNVKNTNPAIMIESEFLYGAGFTIVISNVDRWIGVPGSGGTTKYFENNLRDSRWVFKYNDGGLHPTNANIVPIVQSWFRGTWAAPTNCTPTINQFPGCGAGNPRFALFTIPR